MSAPNIINLPAINFAGNIFTSRASANYNYYYFFCLDNNSVGFIGYNINDLSLDVYIIDKSGAFTFYSTGPLSNPITPGHGFILNAPSGIIRLAANFFFVVLEDAYSGGTVYTFNVQIYNAKLNNNAPILIRNQSLLSNPCNTQGPQYFYDAVKNILAVGFYAPIGEYGGPVNASFYRPSNSGLGLIQSGFVGYYSDAPYYDPFNQSQSNVVGTLVSKSQIYQANGINTALYYDVNNNYFIAAQSYNVNMGAQSNCATPSGASVKTRQSSINYFVNSYYDENTNKFDTTLPGVIGGFDYYVTEPALEFFAGNNIYVTPVNKGENDFFAFNKSGYFALVNISGQVSVSYAAASPIVGFTQYSKQASLLINAHRPVSIFGSYKA